MALTLSELRTRVREYADMENNPHLDDPKANNFINYAAEDLYDLIISIDPSYFVVDYPEFVTQSGVNSYSLPNNMYKLIAVNAKIFGNQLAKNEGEKFVIAEKYKDVIDYLEEIGNRIDEEGFHNVEKLRGQNNYIANSTE